MKNIGIVKLQEDNQLTHKICAMFAREFFWGGKENSFHKFFANKETEDNILDFFHLPTWYHFFFLSGIGKLPWNGFLQ